MRFQGSTLRLFQYYIGGIFSIYYNITWGGGLPNLLHYYNRGGGVYRDPKFVLRNKWTAPKGSADSKITQLISEWPLNQTAVSKIRRLFRRQPRLRKGDAAQSESVPICNTGKMQVPAFYYVYVVFNSNIIGRQGLCFRLQYNPLLLYFLPAGTLIGLYIK